MSFKRQHDLNKFKIQMRFNTVDDTKIYVFNALEKFTARRASTEITANYENIFAY